MLVNVKMDVLNAPANINERSGYLVVRMVRDPHSGRMEFWYYGRYNDKDSAYIAAAEIGNGIVVEV